MTDSLQGGIGGDMLHPSVKEKATAAKSTKKRAASSQVAAAEQEVGEVTAKKAKVRTFQSDFFLYGTEG